MKYHDLDAPASVLRRRLMLALPGGLAMATPLALVGCGGGGDVAGESEADAAASPTNPLVNAPPGEVPATPMMVTIEMPPGVAPKPAFVVSASGAVAVTSNQPVSAEAVKAAVEDAGYQIA